MKNVKCGGYMPDGTSTLIQHGWDWTKGLMVALIGIIGWNGKRLIKRVDDLEKKSVSTDEFNKTVLTLREDFKSYGDRVEKGITRTHERIDKMLDKK